MSSAITIRIAENAPLRKCERTPLGIRDDSRKHIPYSKRILPLLVAGPVTACPITTIFGLARQGVCSHAAVVFCISEAEATATRTAFEQRGELSAVVELRRLFPGC
jgi:hypothetical protein